MRNTLLEPWSGPLETPDFAGVKTYQFLPALREAIASNRLEIAAITSNSAAPDFENTIAALERSGTVLARVRRIFWMLSSAQADEAVRKIETDVSALLTSFGTEISHNTDLFARVASVWNDRAKLTPEQSRLVDRSYRGFVAGGAALDDLEKQRLAAIDARLGALFVQIGQNVLAATNETEMVLSGADLTGIPADRLGEARTRAQMRNLEERAVFVLNRGTFELLLTFADKRSVRESAWRAFTGRCQSDPHNNLPLIAEIVALRQERARLLGYASYADYALEESMAKTPDAAQSLMDRVWRPALVQAQRERDMLQSVVEQGGGRFTLAAWDWRYFAERVRREHFAVDGEAIRGHLMLDRVRDAAFAAATRLYGLAFEQRTDISVYHPDVKAWSVVDREGSPVGVLLTDYLARPEKHGGAWMGSLRVQEKLDGRVLPIIYTVGNFSRADEGEGALLSLDEARTLFHEFGHALHALLSDVTYPSQAGTSVARDFVEFPSKLMEHWVGAPEALRDLGVPDPLIAALEQAEAFGQGFATVEFLASALVDLQLHRTVPAPQDVLAFETDMLRELGIPEAIGMRHRLAYFTHVFDGGYASAYYSYLWSEVLDADAFEAFAASGDIFNREISDRFRREVLAPGDSREPMASFIAFRGRAPDEGALLRARHLV